MDVSPSTPTLKEVLPGTIVTLGMESEGHLVADVNPMEFGVAANHLVFVSTVYIYFFVKCKNKFIFLILLRSRICQTHNFAQVTHCWLYYV